MSNWSVVIVGWSGVDDAVEGGDHESRFKSVVTRYAEISLLPHPEREHEAWTPFYPCPDVRSIGSACEFVAISHQNHFMPKDLLEALRSFPWGYPEEVVVLCKDEQADVRNAVYEQFRLSDL